MEERIVQVFDISIKCLTNKGEEKIFTLVDFWKIKPQEVTISTDEDTFVLEVKRTN